MTRARGAVIATYSGASSFSGASCLQLDALHFLPFLHSLPSGVHFLAFGAGAGASCAITKAEPASKAPANAIDLNNRNIANSCSRARLSTIAAPVLQELRFSKQRAKLKWQESGRISWRYCCKE